MSNYPVWWDTTVTIYNKYVDALTRVTTWHRTTVKNCFWKYVGDKVKIGNTTLETNSVICRVPKQPNFLERHLWVQLPNDKMSAYFTFGVGDIIVKGAVTDNVDEYQAGSRSTDLIKKYKDLQGCMEVQAVTIDTGIGRNNEHYYVRGI